MALLLLMLVAAGPPGASGTMEEKGMENSLGWCVCYQLLNTSEPLPCRLEGPNCPGSLDIWDKTTAGRVKNCTHNAKARDFQTINASLKSDIPACGGDNTTMSPVVSGRISFIIVITILTSSVGMLILILLCVGIMSMILKKWRNKRLFKKQKRWDNFLFKSKAVHYQPDAIYSNVINLVAQKEDDFAIYANIPRFQCPRKTSPVVTYAPDQMEHPSSVFL
ncbi:uncharacterized protein LOC110219651 isoform X1 [Phascolarctos cinereus]|uniref:Uncharacterized protein LOC110219651 isoform X3 n=1 Tax=Phascolarctos cinereus TaxID=38626 RepID=A0A6P5LRB5_PHACI|nr:uncharacterized protein LOC110219651 isoform X3 [Phascolarctos cinereus]